MRAEVIAIGDELTSGQRLDTNSQWLSERLNEIGIPVVFHTTVGDDLDDNIIVFRTAIDRADVVIATGGLGPTADDLTRDAIAAATGFELNQDAIALAYIQDLFARRNRPMPERNKLQAMFPRGSRLVPNPEGTAPGIDLTVPRSGRSPTRVIALPGVPAEMFAMWKETVAPALLADQPERRIIRHHRVKCFGVGESDLEAMVPEMIARKREPLVGITVHGATITLRITASCRDEADFRHVIEPTLQEIQEKLGSLVFGEEDEELEHAVARLLQARGQSVAVAEWATDGLVSQWLAEATGAGDTFRGGAVIHNLATLNALACVTVTPDALATKDTAERMACSVRLAMGADFGLGIAAFPVLGEASPNVAHQIDTGGTLYVALAASDNVRSKGFLVGTHPSIIKSRSAKQALNMLRLVLINHK